MQATTRYRHPTIQQRAYYTPPEREILTTLPDELLLRIFNLTGLRDHFRLQMTCRQFYLVAKDEYLWKTHYLNIFPTRPLTCMLPFAKNKDFWEKSSRDQVQIENKLLRGKVERHSDLPIPIRNARRPYSEVGIDPVLKSFFSIDSSSLESYNFHTRQVSIFPIGDSCGPQINFELFGVFQGRYAVIERKSLSSFSTKTPNIAVYDIEKQKYLWSSIRYERHLLSRQFPTVSSKIPYFFSTATKTPTSFSFILRDFLTGNIRYQKDFENVAVAYKKFRMIQTSASIDQGIVLIRYASQNTQPYPEQYYIFQINSDGSFDENTMQDTTCLGFDGKNGTYIMRDGQGICSFWKGTSCLNDKIDIGDDVVLDDVEKAHFYSSILCLYSTSKELCLYDMENKKTLVKTRFISKVHKYFIYKSLFCIHFRAWRSNYLRVYDLENNGKSVDFEHLDWILGKEKNVLIGITTNNKIAVWDKTTGVLLHELSIFFYNRNTVKYSDGMLYVYRGLKHQSFQIHSFL